VNGTFDYQPFCIPPTRVANPLDFRHGEVRVLGLPWVHLNFHLKLAATAGAL